jgi:hypothetical protein
MTRPGRAALVLVIFCCVLTSCAHMVNTLNGVDVGMTRDEALQAVGFGPHEVSDGKTEYLIYRVVTNFFAWYGDKPNSLLFVRLENGMVTNKGVIGRREKREIRRIDPSFDVEVLRGN